MEDSNALALAIVPSQADAAPTFSAQSKDFDPSGWELTLVSTPSTDISSNDRQLAGGLDSLTLNSLYDEGAYRASQQPVYGQPAPNPFEVHDPFAYSNNVAAPPAVQMATMESCENAVDHISVVKAAADAVKLTAEFLVGKLATGSPDIQRQAAYELRLLAKTGMDNRRVIAEAGAIPFQENAVTALLNLSIFNNNKILIMAAGAIDNIINVLELGNTMEARENAAATIFSLSMIDYCKVTIGKRPRAIPALVGLLQDGTPAGKKDAAIALSNLAVYNDNKVSLVVAGVVPLLIDLLMDAGVYNFE